MLMRRVWVSAGAAASVGAAAAASVGSGSAAGSVAAGSSGAGASAACVAVGAAGAGASVAAGAQAANSMLATTITLKVHIKVLRDIVNFSSSENFYTKSLLTRQTHTKRCLLILSSPKTTTSFQIF
ncbi:MAG: hypothetical protein EHM21_16225 [Chloroflexi bacterium]|nr:MAG: hypothetical protein EHM21_16225 [Chloroflexota bacterium]